MERSRLAVALTIYIVVLLAFATFRGAAAAEDAGAIPPAPMQSAAEVAGAPVAVAAIVSVLAWFF